MRAPDNATAPPSTKDPVTNQVTKVITTKPDICHVIDFNKVLISVPLSSSCLPLDGHSLRKAICVSGEL